MRVKIKLVNDMAVSDEHLNIIISKSQSADIDSYQCILQNIAEEGSERS